MCEGYGHQIRFLVQNLTSQIDALESTVVTGATDEQVIKPGLEKVSKAMDKYQQGMKSIRSSFVLWLHAGYYGG